jgi:hypothetical protein
MGSLTKVSAHSRKLLLLETSLLQPGWMIPAETLSLEIFLVINASSGRAILAQNVRPFEDSVILPRMSRPAREKLT